VPRRQLDDSQHFALGGWQRLDGRDLLHRRQRSHGLPAAA
jgi:hypothetical protein